MSPHQRARVEELFKVVVACAHNVQRAELERLCPDDPEVLSKVAALLRASLDTDFHKSEIVGRLGGLGSHLDELCDELPVGTQFGDYVVQESLKEGGLGRVYKVAERTDVSRVVALKVIKPGLDTREVLARFKIERQVLANMAHPNIAKLFRAGSTERGRPFFIMEYVPGVPINEFADQNRLSIAERLRLFGQVCDAISHAHQKAVIHRDIKSANILAYIADGKPAVKVIDFGIAKVLNGDCAGQNTTHNTNRGDSVGTLDSMSPEQVDGRPDIDTRTDVYSLGVVLYELLCGAKPFAKAGVAETRRLILEQMPPRPSARLLSDVATGNRTADARQTSLGNLSRDLRSELDWIPLMAMRKEREARYQTPMALLADIDNYLNHIPVKAKPPTVLYHAKKFARRHRAILSVILLFMCLVALGGAEYVRGIRVEQLKTRDALSYALSQETNAKAAESHTSDLLAEEEEVNRILASDRRLSGRLRRTLGDIHYDDVGFSDVIQLIRDITGYDIWVDWKSAATVGVKQDTPVSVALSAAQFDQFMDALVQSVCPDGALAWVIQDDGITVIASRSVLANTAITAGIDVLPITNDSQQMGSMLTELHTIVDQAGGEIFQGAGVIYVRATIGELEQIARAYSNTGLTLISRKGSYGLCRKPASCAAESGEPPNVLLVS